MAPLLPRHTVKDFDRAEFDPSPTAHQQERVLNLYTGMNYDVDDFPEGLTDAVRERVKPWLDHLKNQCGAGDGTMEYDEEVFEYYVNWQAHIVQRPWVKQPVAVVLTGMEGTGKGYVAQMLRRVIGDDHFLQFANMEGLSHFQCPKERTNLLTVFDELRLTIGKLPELKFLITEVSKQFNEKYVAAKTVKSLSNYLILSNDEMPLPVVTESDRRFLILKSDSTLAGTTGMNPLHWKALYAVKARDVFCFLKNRDLSGYFPAAQLPGSKPKFMMKMKGAEPQVQWLYQQLSEGSEGLFSGKEFVKDEIYRSFSDYAAGGSEYVAVRQHSNSRSSPKVLSSPRFWVWMQAFFVKLQPQLKELEHRVRNKVAYSGQKVIVRLWSFEQARKIFCAYIHEDVVWAVDQLQPMDNEAASDLHTPAQQASAGGATVLVQQTLAFTLPLPPEISLSLLTP